MHTKFIDNFYIENKSMIKQINKPIKILFVYFSSNFFL